jgi:glycosyltransferase 2 family protein
MVVDAVQDVRKGDLVLHLRPQWLLLSGLFVLATYFLLIGAWLYIVAGLSGKRIRYLDGARIWFVSNLGTLLPGRVWGIVQMGAMSVDAGISPVAAGAASIINTAVNIATGMAVGVIAGAPILMARYGAAARWAWIPATLALIGVVALPVLIPWAFRLARRFGLKVPEQRLPARLIGVSAAANVLAWCMYGVAFLCLNRALIDLGSYDLIQHIAVNATSYVAGYLFLPSPAGLGVREETLKAMMLAAHMGNPAQAGAVAVVSRLWQLIIQVLPALIFLAYRRPPNEKDAAAG